MLVVLITIAVRLTYLVVVVPSAVCLEMMVHGYGGGDEGQGIGGDEESSW